MQNDESLGYMVMFKYDGDDEWSSGDEWDHLMDGLTALADAKSSDIWDHYALVELRVVAS